MEMVQHEVKYLFLIMEAIVSSQVLGARAPHQVRHFEKKAYLMHHGGLE